MTETGTQSSDHLRPSTTPKSDDKLNFSTLSSISTLDTSSPFNTISTTASNETLAGESLISKSLIDSVFSTLSDNSMGDIDLSLNVSRNSLSSATMVEKHNSVSTKHNSVSTKTNSISRKHNSVISNDINNKGNSNATHERKRDFRTPTSSFLLTPTDERFNNIDLGKFSIEPSETKIQIPETFSSVSLNLDIGDFTTGSTEQKPISTSPPQSSSPTSTATPRTAPTPNDESKEEEIGSKKARSDCGCAIM